MKKIISLITITALACIMCFTASAKGTFTAPKGSPTIDGTRDSVYGDSFRISDTVEGGSGNATGEACAAWDDTYIYVYVKVNDDKPNIDTGISYNSDSVEIYLDFNNKKTSQSMISNSGAAAQIRFQRGANANDDITGYGGTQEGSFWTKVYYDNQLNYVVKEVSGGYVVEARIPHYNYPKSTIGFTVQINDDMDKDDIRDFTVFPTGSDMAGNSQSYKYSDLLDNLTLTGRNDSDRTEPVADKVETTTQNPPPSTGGGSTNTESSKAAVSSSAASSKAAVSSAAASSVSSLTSSADAVRDAEESSDNAETESSAIVADASKNTNDGGVPIGLIIGIVIAVIVIAGVVVAIIIVRKKGASSALNAADSNIDEAETEADTSETESDTDNNSEN